MIRLSELRYKEVINECTCRRLGCIEDLEFDEKCGQICAVIIPGQCKCFGLFMGKLLRHGLEGPFLLVVLIKKFLCVFPGRQGGIQGNGDLCIIVII